MWCISGRSATVSREVWPFFVAQHPLCSFDSKVLFGRAQSSIVSFSHLRSEGASVALPPACSRIGRPCREVETVDPRPAPSGVAALGPRPLRLLGSNRHARYRMLSCTFACGWFTCTAVLGATQPSMRILQAMVGGAGLGAWAGALETQRCTTARA